MKRIAIVGCGNMGEAILKGLIKKGLFKRADIIFSDARAARLSHVNRLYKVNTAFSNAEAIRRSDLILLAVKPQDMAGLLEETTPLLENKLIISIAAGITTEFIRKRTGAKRIIRVMPNTPALVGCGITAVSAARGANSSDIRIADMIFGSVGEVVHLKERYIDAVTAVSGSGPAYFFLMMEALTDAAASLGVKRAAAEKLVSETAFGAAMLQHGNRADPSYLREKVTSKSGTTEAAINVFKSRGFEKIVKDAVRTAAKRAKEMSLM